MSQSQYNQPNIISTLVANGLKVFTRPMELNIIGVRSSNTISNKFDDILYLCYLNSSNTWVQHRFALTTDPGLHFINKPMNSNGTALLKQGQYLNAYALGIHRGKYKALVQRKPITVYRSKNKSRDIDTKTAHTQTGYFGINIHHASGNGTSEDVDRWSAGCQVIADINNFKLLMKLAEQQANLYGNHFTYTLLDYRTKGYKAELIDTNKSNSIITNHTNEAEYNTEIKQNPSTPIKTKHSFVKPLLVISLLGIVSTGCYYISKSNFYLNINHKK
jgi:hypothetical protein